MAETEAMEKRITILERKLESLEDLYGRRYKETKDAIAAISAYADTNEVLQLEGAPVTTPGKSEIDELDPVPLGMVRLHDATTECSMYLKLSDIVCFRESDCAYSTVVYTRLKKDPIQVFESPEDVSRLILEAQVRPE